jgi:hypothetical protein
MPVENVIVLLTPRTQYRGIAGYVALLRVVYEDVLVQYFIKLFRRDGFDENRDLLLEHMGYDVLAKQLLKRFKVVKKAAETFCHVASISFKYCKRPSYEKWLTYMLINKAFVEAEAASRQ